VINLSKFPIPYRERQDFSEKYSETLVVLLEKYLQRRLPPEWGYEIKRDLEESNGNMDALTLRLYTRNSKEAYSNSTKIPFLIYEPNKIYVAIPSFSDIEREIFGFIKTSTFDYIKKSSVESSDSENEQKKTRLQRLKILVSKAKVLKAAK